MSQKIEEDTSDTKESRSYSDDYRKLFIGGLTYDTTDEMLQEYYSQWGEVVDCIVMRDPTTKRSRGFGFVTYSESKMLDAAMAGRPHILDEKTVESKRAIPRNKSAGQATESNMSVKRLYISGVREGHTEQIFRDYFSEYGNVLDVEVFLDKVTGKPRGFAFVTFDDYDAVDKCILKKSHMIAGNRCDVKKALSKEETYKSQQHDRERSQRNERSRGTVRGGGGDAWSGGGGNWNQQGGGRGGWGQNQRNWGGANTRGRGVWNQGGPNQGYGNYGASNGEWNQGGGYSNGPGYGNYNGGQGWGVQQPQMGGWGGAPQMPARQAPPQNWGGQGPSQTGWAQPQTPHPSNAWQSKPGGNFRS